MTDMIADLPLDERPRERLLAHGIETLSDSEVIALLLGSGTSGKNAIQLARELLTDGMALLGRRDPISLAKVRGIGEAKASRVVAAFELARRIVAHKPDDPPAYVEHDLACTFIRKLGRIPQERLFAVFLDSRRRIIRQREIYRGTIDRALVSTRDIVRFALQDNATGVVLCHNHPTGGVTPSVHDKTFTEKMQYSLGLIDTTLVDHLIVGEHQYYSMLAPGVA